jgi:hypothetical protein
VKRSAVLIFSEDSLAAALLGAVVELGGFRPAFPTDGDSPRDALLRVRARAVLIECNHAACGPSFFGPALMMGARVVLVGSRRSGDPRGLADAFGLRAITLPADVESIADVLRAELESRRREG